MDYSAFLREKVNFDRSFGFDVNDADIHPILKPHQRAIVRWAVAGGRRAIFAAFGLGKAQPVDEPVLTPTGWKPIGELAVGDDVVSADGRPTRIIGVFPQGERPLVEVAFNDGSTTRCDEDHLWTVATDADVFQERPWRTTTARELAASVREPNGRLRWRIPMAEAIQHPTADLPIDPYVMGVLLGDGSFRKPGGPSFTTIDPEIVTEVKNRLPAGMRVTEYDRRGEVAAYRLVVEGMTNWNKTNPFLAATKTWGLHGLLAYQKFIPAEYSTGDPVQRLDLLRGLMDTDGFVARDGTIQFNSSSPELAAGVMALVQSLGGTARRASKVPTYTHKGKRRFGREHFTVTVRLPNGCVPFALPRKVARCRDRYYAPLRKIASVTPVGSSEAVCIAVEHPSHLYITRDYLVTHNTVMQLETVRLTLAQSGGKYGLIVCPLGVRQEFVHDAVMLGAIVRFVRTPAEMDGPGIYLTNYESVRDGKLDPNLFDAVSLDEAAVLRSFGSKTYQSFLTLFDEVPYRFVATATPSPNRYKELIHYAGFLGVMDTGNALTRFFQRDSTQANNLTLYPHKRDEFHLWLNTWAAFLQSPADIGCDATGYVLPPLDVEYHEVEVDHTLAAVDRDGQGHLFRGGALGVSDAAREKRDTLPGRIAELTHIVDSYAAADPTDQLVIWCDLNVEQDAIEAALTERGLTFSSVHGGLSPDEAEARIVAWKARETYALVGKPVMLGQGLTLQQANKAIFIGVTYKFNDLIQACHRIQRFGQTRPCRVHIVHAESEREVVRILREKWAQHRELTSTMTAVIREHGLDPAAISEALTRSMGVERIEASGEGWTFARNDCVLETQTMADDSVDLIVTSIPFSNHYEYTPAYEDFGHTDDNDHFWAQMDYLTPQLLRVLAPGRIYACHVKDRILFGAVTGAGVPTVSPFHAEALMHGIKHGFDYMGMITVVTDVVRENNQTYRLGWSEQCKDGTKMGAGSPEYILLFHKPQTDRSKGYADTPVTKDKASYTRARWQVDAHAFWRSSGDRQITPDELAALNPDQMGRLFTEHTLRRIYDYESHIRIGEALDGRGVLPSTFMSLAPGSWHKDVWTDIERMITLNTEQSRRAQVMHVCPLPLGIVDRLISRYSNPGDLVFDPFGGLATVPVRALKASRRGRGVELNLGYFLDGVKYCEAEERRHDMPSLFELEPAASS